MPRSLLWSCAGQMQSKPKTLVGVRYAEYMEEKISPNMLCLLSLEFLNYIIFIRVESHRDEPEEEEEAGDMQFTLINKQHNQTGVHLSVCGLSALEIHYLRQNKPPPQMFTYIRLLMCWLSFKGWVPSAHNGCKEIHSKQVFSVTDERRNLQLSFWGRCILRFNYSSH